MSVRRRVHDYWTEVQRIVIDQNGDPQVKTTTCCCKAPAAMRRICARFSGHKTPCRCDCHSERVGRDA